MKVIDPGHEYKLQNFENESYQTLIFVKKEPVSDGSQELKTTIVGTTNEEILSALIDRLHFLNGEFPCRENSVAITKLDEALMWLNKRTADRMVRGVEGTNQK